MTEASEPRLPYMLSTDGSRIGPNVVTGGAVSMLSTIERRTGPGAEPSGELRS